MRWRAVNATLGTCPVHRVKSPRCFAQGYQPGCNPNERLGVGNDYAGPWRAARCGGTIPYLCGGIQFLRQVYIPSQRLKQHAERELPV